MGRLNRSRTSMRAVCDDGGVESLEVRLQYCQLKGQDGQVNLTKYL